MRFQVRHVTNYRYSEQVYCEPLTVRLRPRNDFRQRLVDFSLSIQPAPVGTSEGIDLEGNHASLAWFSGLTEELAVTASFVAQTRRIDPYDFLLRPDAAKLPLLPTAEEEPLFGVYGRPSARSSQLDDLVHELARQAEFATVPFVRRLNEWIFCEHEKILRPWGAPWRPAETLSQQRGSCRDLAVLLIEGCRIMNIPSRFVSGYGAGTEDALERQLHAWAEVYLPGAGWRGFDPSLGLAITEQHLAVATGRTPADAAPTTGTYRGQATSTLEAEIDMQTSAGDWDFAHASAATP